MASFGMVKLLVLMIIAIGMTNGDPCNAGKCQELCLNLKPGVVKGICNQSTNCCECYTFYGDTGKCTAGCNIGQCDP
ncbi:hypothetical protein V9T40_011322 [Parthenolecanium corni]|uniref:Uncharacterized protein n=1 Tax=Parthenolecanium corni TaxID=536013 RepID=A0AAN9T6U2_9HEMI